ncbi:MAG TPA: hemin uptake protein HemP [Rhodocyclaceae bacterium]|nr:hemin uptake protein HemP [Rhodocyclaceae bacterium]HRQ48623.1 hemin uptake protein HemP [Rhodocyclaceae bacterium]
MAQQPVRSSSGIAPAAADRGTADARYVCSAELLDGRSSIAIDHEGTRYVLRATRAGKLILTK